MGDPYGSTSAQPPATSEAEEPSRHRDFARVVEAILLPLAELAAAVGTVDSDGRSRHRGDRGSTARPASAASPS